LRGGTTGKPTAIATNTGLSPLARGNLCNAHDVASEFGSIPACAGEPRRQHARPCGLRVYPRLRGGTMSPLITWSLTKGLSPLARGNQGHRHQPIGHPGSIPACAGEPFRAWLRAKRHRVYPRLRGGTIGFQPIIHLDQGLSPLARGNRRGGDGDAARSGSIPACAGEPYECEEIVASFGVYPRLRGGTAVGAVSIGQMMGLSPLARGNRRPLILVYTMRGSIPACAGEPQSRRPWPSPIGVYPRLRGGTMARRVIQSKPEGLSPLARGNLAPSPSPTLAVRSIPACAGEPSDACRSVIDMKVYPRLRGGTSLPLSGEWRCGGLSPLARGNPSVYSARRPAKGSIPACAGEPMFPYCSIRDAGVYPRLRGGTPLWSLRTPLCRGLSPLARGNRARPLDGRPRMGSIPACAGEPCG